VRLLQLSAGRPAADNDRTTAASAERSRSPGVRTRAEGTCYCMPSAAALASGLLAGPVQVVLYHALDLSWQLAGVSDEYRSFCRCQPIPFRSALWCTDTSASRHFGTGAEVSWCRSVPRAALSTNYAMPHLHLRTKFGERAFSHALLGTHCWRTFVRHQTLLFLEDSLKLIILA